MEELGIGRPSTYASILGTIVDRGYAWRKGSALVPTWIAFAVVNLLEEHFGRLVDYQFTSSVEDDLDEIAAGSRDRGEWLTRFYFGSDEGREGGMARAGGLKRMVESRLADIDAREVNSIPIGETRNGEPIMVRVGRYGPYVSVGTGEDTARASVPEDLAPDELTVEKALELLAQPSGDRELGIDPEHRRAGHAQDRALRALRRARRARRTRRRGRQERQGEGAAPTLTRASLFKDMDPATVTLDEVLPLLTLPRTLGTDPDEGRAGHRAERALRALRQAGQRIALARQPSHSCSRSRSRRRWRCSPSPKLRGRAAAAPPLRELGNDPVSNKPMVIREGRFGPYVTDGETNASLRKGDSIEEITAARASELLADRRARGPAPAKARRADQARPAKKAAKKAARARKS